MIMQAMISDSISVNQRATNSGQHKVSSRPEQSDGCQESFLELYMASFASTSHIYLNESCLCNPAMVTWTHACRPYGAWHACQAGSTGCSDSPSGASRILGMRSMVVKTLPIALEAFVMSACPQLLSSPLLFPEFVLCVQSAAAWYHAKLGHQTCHLDCLLACAIPMSHGGAPLITMLDTEVFMLL